MVRVGILGTGFGEHHAKLYRNIDGFEVASIFGRNADKLKKINDELGIPVTTDINKVIQDPAIDLLDICLPTELHAQWAIEGIKNNKHIFCETPVAYAASEAEAIQQAAAKYGKNVYVNLFIKFSAPHQLALSLVEKAEPGSLLSVRAYNKTSPRWGDLGLKKNIENFHNHNMDFVLALAGLPLSVIASGIDFGGKSIVTSALAYDGLYAVLESNSSLPDCCPFAIGFELLFSNGVVCYDAVFGDYPKEEFSITRKDRPREVVQLDSRDDCEETFRHVLLCLQNNTKSGLIDIEAAVKEVKLKEMILRSLAERNVL